MAAKSPTGKISIVLRPISPIWLGFGFGLEIVLVNWGVQDQHTISILLSMQPSSLEVSHVQTPNDLNLTSLALSTKPSTLDYSPNLVISDDVFPRNENHSILSSAISSCSSCLFISVTICKLQSFDLTDTLLSQLTTPGTDYYVPSMYFPSAQHTHLSYTIIILPFALTTFPCSLVPHLLILMLVYFLHLWLPFSSLP